MSINELRLVSSSSTPSGPRATYCPHPEKARFETWVKAQAFMQELRKRDPADRTEKIPHRAYFCDCKTWHLASTPAKCGEQNRLVCPSAEPEGAPMVRPAGRPPSAA